MTHPTHRNSTTEILIGAIEVIAHDERRVQVRIGDNVTDWLRVPVLVGRNFVAWRALEVGMQVSVSADRNDLSHAEFLGPLDRDSDLAPSTDPDVDVIEFRDGTRIAHNNNEGVVSVSGAKELNISAGTIRFSGDHILITGPISHEGSQTVTGDVVASEISLVNHVHDGILPGPADTGGPK